MELSGAGLCAALRRNAVCNAGAGIIGEYSYCSTCVKSLGTFIPNDNAKPYIGENNKLEDHPCFLSLKLIDNIFSFLSTIVSKNFLKTL